MTDCSPDYPVLGMQAGEELATMLRLVALVFSVSVLFPWLSSDRRGRMRIFFLHWFSGAMYVLSQFVLSVMVLNCWSSKGDSGRFIFFLKFVELAVLNLWSISSLAIAILIASIVQSFVKFRRVPTVFGSARAALWCVAAAVLATLLSAVFWNGLLITGGYVWVTNTESTSHARWISLSFGATQTVAGILMALTVLFTVTGERFASLKVCCRTSQRVKFHFILTIFGTCVYLYNGIVLLFDEFSDFKISRRLVIIGWCSRYVHVIADTGIILVAFLALDKKDEEKTGVRGSSGSGGERSSRLIAASTTATATMRQGQLSSATAAANNKNTGSSNVNGNANNNNSNNVGNMEAGLKSSDGRPPRPAASAAPWQTRPMGLSP